MPIGLTSFLILLDYRSLKARKDESFLKSSIIAEITEI